MRKSSKQRQIMLEYIRSVKHHLTAGEIFNELKRQGESVSLATVYRNLGILVELKEIQKVPSENDGFLYDSNLTPHYHLHCVECGDITDLPIAFKGEWNLQLQEELSVQVISHSVTVEGICPICEKRKRSVS